MVQTAYNTDHGLGSWSHITPGETQELKQTSASMEAPKLPGHTIHRRNITDINLQERPETLEMITKPDQFIDTDNLRFIPMESANTVIISKLY